MLIDWSKLFAMSSFPPVIVLVSCLWMLGMKNIKPTILDAWHEVCNKGCYELEHINVFDLLLMVSS